MLDNLAFSSACDYWATLCESLNTDRPHPALHATLYNTFRAGEGKPETNEILSTPLKTDIFGH